VENKNMQVRNHVLDLLESGSLSGQGKLPGARELAARLGISLLTVQNALETLVNEGVLRVIPRQGTFTDPAWENRILQSNVSFYMPEKHLPWSFRFGEIVAEHLPQLHLTHRMRNGIFEIRPTLDVQTRHKEYLDAEPFFRKCCPNPGEFFDTPVQAFYYGKKLAGIPILFSPRVLFVNLKMLEQAGCPVPEPDWMWDDFLECIRILLKTFAPECVFHWSPAYFLWMNFVLRAGGALIDPSAPDPVLIDSEKTRLGLQLFRDLRRILEKNGSYHPQGIYAFEHGTLAFMVDARQAVGRLLKTGMDGWTTLPLPHIPGGCDTTIQATELLCIRKECVNLDTAEQLVNLLLSEEFQDHIADLGYGIPLRKSSAERSLATSLPGNDLFRTEVKNMCSRYYLDSEELAALVSTGIGELLTGNQDIDQGTSELAELVRSYFRIQRKTADAKRTTEETISIYERGA